MKKIIITLALLLSFNNIYAGGPDDFLNKVPNNFTPQCYEYYNEIDKSNFVNYSMHKVQINNTKDLVITQWDYILPYKYYSDNKDIYSYSSNFWFDNDLLTDYNNKTSIDINSKTQNEIILDFDEKLEKNNFSFIFSYDSFDYWTEYYISQDRKNWDKVNRINISEFSFKYFKINFVSKTEENYLENIKIFELNFPKKSNTILINSFTWQDIKLYSNYNCKNKNYSTYAKTYDKFSISSETPSIKVDLITNPEYNVFTVQDKDNDWVEDSVDNCKSIYNPFQRDINWDWKWDLCSDDDRDWIIWEKDNCIYISNRDQKDINRNWIWDVCEFDKDKDGLFDSQDNCINISNVDQMDDDKDGIWNSCDNCKNYNPTQTDENNNGIWDLCEKQDEHLKENDKDSDWIIDNKDNCKYIANTNQADNDKDWIWDVCDNCTNIQNKDQLDFNKNGVWDICEDSDWDGVTWLTDNCINIVNPDQMDDDNNGVWNLCEDKDSDKILFDNDNCPFDYNPEQTDVDNDWIWDKCDEEDNRYIESNSGFFIWLLVAIIIIFWLWIYAMLKKLK